PEQSDRVAQVAEEFRGRALDETRAREHEVARSRSAARVSQYFDYAFYLVYALRTIRLVLSLIAALAASDITAAAVHNHLVGETPMIYFVHFWGDAPLAVLLRGLRAAVDAASAH
ncbi:MAG: DUF1259 domain-containing protein, partial [bacterium]